MSWLRIHLLTLSMRSDVAIESCDCSVDEPLWLYCCLSTTSLCVSWVLAWTIPSTIGLGTPWSCVSGQSCVWRGNGISLFFHKMHHIGRHGVLLTPPPSSTIGISVQAYPQESHRKFSILPQLFFRYLTTIINGDNYISYLVIYRHRYLISVVISCVCTKVAWSWEVGALSDEFVNKFCYIMHAIQFRMTYFVKVRILFFEAINVKFLRESFMNTYALTRHDH